MGFFAILNRPGRQTFRVEKLDINLAVLPGVLGQYATYCDVGVRLAITSGRPDGNGPDRLQFEVCLPFVTEAGEITDLIPLIRDDKLLANLVFGNDGDAPRSQGGATYYFDGEKDIAFASYEPAATQIGSTDRRIGFSYWTIQSDGPVLSGSTVYMRVRFRVRIAGRTWAWQSGPRRRSHAISDLRINELREKPEIDRGPDFSNTMLPINEANVFVSTPSNLRAGRVSPAPSNVRILEGRGWERYMERRIGTSNSVLLVTHWKTSNITSVDPFRGLIEVEKRSPTPIRAALIAAALALAGFVVLSPPNTLMDSSIGIFLSNFVVWVTGLSAATAVLIYKILLPLVLNKRYRLIKNAVRWYEKKRYKLPR